MQQSYSYTQLCNYRESCVLKPTSNQSNILAGCKWSFTRSLNASHLEIDE